MALLQNTAEAWKIFFHDSGIPEESCTQYADLFIENRITGNSLSELDKQTLVDIGITVLGDRLSILKHVKTVSGSNTASMITNPSLSQQSPKISAKLPSALSDMTHPQFRKFRIDWSIYKNITNIATNQISSILYNACSESVQSSIVNTCADFITLCEEDFLNVIERLVTKRSNPAVHRLNFRSIKQNEHESIQEFEVRLRTAAVDCEYTCPDCSHSLSDLNIKDQFISGIYNETLQTDILAKSNQLKSLDAIINHAKSYETAIRDQSELHDKSEAIQAARTSDYKRSKQFNSKRKPSYKPQCCSGCGSTSHGIPGTPDRANTCPAWGKSCLKCNIQNHFASACRRSSTNMSHVQLSEDLHTGIRGDHSNLIAHVQYDETRNEYTIASTQLVEEIPAQVTPLNHSATNKSSKLMQIFPDSGATICIAGTQHMAKLGLTEHDLIPCRKRIVAVGGSTIPCEGWTPVEFKIGEHTTKQPLYICRQVDRIYFSKTGCIETNIIPPSFPYPMTTKHQSAAVKPTHTKSIKESAPTNNTSYSTKEETIPRQSPPPKPTTLPYPPISDNIIKLEQYIKNAFKTSTFNNSPPFPSMETVPAHIHLKDNPVPFAQHVPIPVPYHYKQQVKASLDRDVARGIIKPVPIGTPVEWCAPMVTVEKNDGTPRRTIDFQRLNAQSLRETHHTLPPFHLASQIPPNTYKTVVDATDGYHGILLDEESQLLTVFITEWGRYMYLRLPQGYKAAGDAYTRRYDDVICDVKRKVKIIDDSLLHDDTIEEAFFHVWNFLTLLANSGVVANIEKFKFARQTIEFAGLLITPSGIEPSPKLLMAIQNFPTPTNITNARSWFGLVNQLSWAYAISPIMRPFRELIKPHVQFYWDDTLESLFAQSKIQLMECVKSGVKSFDCNKRTCLQTDWSKDGVGYLLLQQHCQCDIEKAPLCCKDGWRLVYAGSRFTTPRESKLYPTEGEALALSWSLHHSRIFTQGCNDLIISVDHKPLLGIFNNKCIASINNPFIFKLKESTLNWHFTVKYNPGKWHYGADALSRNPSIATIQVDDKATGSSLSPIREAFNNSDSALMMSCEEHIEALEIGCLNSLCHNIISVRDIKDASQKDHNYTDLITTIQQGFPSSKQATKPHIREYWEVRNRLTSSDGIVLLDKRIVIPSTMRRLVLEHLHVGHQGVTSMKARANISVYWPGIDSSIKQYKGTCADCLKNAASQQREPIILTTSPEYPFQKICTDFFFIEQHAYLVVVDRFSGWPIVYYFKPGEATSSRVINICREIFMTYGTPEEISSDGGPQFKSINFDTFLKSWGVKHRISSADYPQSNGRSEVGVQSMKRILHDNINNDGSLHSDKVALAILQYRNTPLQDIKLSPAQILLHRQLRDGIPTHPSLHKPHKDWLITAHQRENALANRNRLVTERYNATARELPPLSIGDAVVIQSRQLNKKRWIKAGHVIEVLPNRQYRIKLEGSGRITLQNRRFLRRSVHLQPSIIPSPSVPQSNPDRGLGEHSPNLSEQDPLVNTDSGLRESVQPCSPPLNTSNATNNVINLANGGSATAPTQTPPSHNMRKLPRELKNLLSYNKPGLNE